ncbi:aspartyl/asparaginyl beta-hydroxylase-like isoform X2 [Argiope bruennichi]|uniref:aspartyl/asparaginyl beta-hydroxylase-like isoform X2 n=1 Tax=Argiope bruennichi TaxID=94029 RepID=UPI002495496B|nr:aspartyl/asparaginyl beta-hydroxylase-like isoform X2 [Argiope bruennichi]
MSDKEPRRRKKRKDTQPPRKEDVHTTDDHFFMPSKSEGKDSDQELEEEVVIPTHQPSVFAKFVFVLLFSGLVVSLSFIFISLHGTDRGEVDIFNGHSEEIEVPHDEHDFHDHEHHDHDIHDHEEEESLQENIADYFPSIGSILSFNDEHSKESVKESFSDNVGETDSSDEQLSEPPAPSSTDEYISSTNENSIESDVEDTEQSIEIPITTETHTDTLEEPESVSFQSDASHDEVSYEQDYEISPEHEPEVEKQDDEETSENIIEYSDSSNYVTEAEPPESVTESYTSSVDDILPTTPAAESKDEHPFDQDDIDSDDFIDAPPENTVEEEVTYYEKESITNEEDFKIREQLDELDEILQKSPERALRKCEELLQSQKQSPRLHYVKAQVLDKLAETQRSNKLLEEAIAQYQKVMSIKNVPEELYLIAGKRAADRMRFRGFLGRCVKLLSEMAEKYPQNTDVKNLLAVGYLMIGQNKEAKRVLSEVLKVKPDSGFAKVHLGFILKTDDSKYTEAAQLLSEGIATREEGVIDGRFFFHLGDALYRIGKQDEAMKVYKDGVQEGLFLSEYQRSLYNVNGLTGKPWWDPMKTTYGPYFKILEKNWISIRDEALSLTNEKNSGFLPETEGLQDTGDWKQFELFARGRKVEKNCLKAPKTCSLISQFPDAVNCKRGQVKFSIMQPQTHVWAHTGPTNCRLRAHLGLVIPEGTSIRVATETRTWEEGKVILFDDSFEHEVWHNGTESRLVLIVDFWHPELTAYQKKSLTPI